MWHKIASCHFSMGWHYSNLQHILLGYYAMEQLKAPDWQEVHFSTSCGEKKIKALAHF